MSQPYRPDVDGLRALAVLPVLLFHAQAPGFAGGFVGVDVFFVISGYLITGIILDQQQQGSFSLVSFYERRARRLLPALLVVAASTLLGAALLLPPARFAEIAESAAATMAFSANIYFWATSGYFSTASTLQPLIHMWSLGVEEQFYLLFPLLMIGLRGAPKWRTVAIVTMAMASLACSEYLARTNPVAAFYLPHSRAFELLVGALVAMASRQVSPGRMSRRAIPLAGLALILVPMATYDEKMTLPGLAMLVPTAGTALILFAHDREGPVGRLLSLRPLVMIGLLSYSLYLWHQPLLALGRLVTANQLHPAWSAAMLLVSFPLAWLTWRFIERPFRSTERVRLPVFVAFSVSATIGVFGLALAAILTQGLQFRASPGYAELNAEFDRHGKLRVEGIKYETCHLPSSNADVVAFNAGWRCHGERAGARLLILGDSHAADKAWALRTAGIEPAQMTGAGCSLVPRHMSPTCRSIFTHALAELRDRPDITLLLTQSVLHGAMSEQDMREALTFFQEYGRPILLASPMPAFPQIKDEMGKRVLAGSDPFRDLYPFSDANAKAGKAAMEALGLPTFDTQAAFCSISGGSLCLPHANGEILLIDPDHLSQAAAEGMGWQLAEFVRLNQASSAAQSR